MDTEMSTKTKDEVMDKMRARYGRAGRDYRRRMIDEAVAHFWVSPQGGDPGAGRKSGAQKAAGGGGNTYF
jgi:hypothetical protein